MSEEIILALLIKWSISILLVSGGICALFIGKSLYLRGIGLKEDNSTIETGKGDFNIKMSLKNTGTTLMVTACVWGVSGLLASPSFEKGDIKVASKELKNSKRIINTQPKVQAQTSPLPEEAGSVSTNEGEKAYDIVAMWMPKASTLVSGAYEGQGAYLYSSYCAHCHGLTGNGDGPTAKILYPRPKSFADGKYINFISNLDLFKIIKGGGKAGNLTEAMPPWGNILQNKEIWNIIAFIRTLAKNPEYKLNPDFVTAVSAKNSSKYKEINEKLETELTKLANEWFDEQLISKEAKSKTQNNPDL